MTGKVTPLRLAVAIPLMMAGVGGFVTLLLLGLGGMTRDLQRLDVPGSRRMTFEEGDYTVYWETRSSWGSKGAGPEVDVRIAAPGSPSPVAVHRSTFFASHYQTDGRAGNSSATFHIDRGGAYEVSAQAPQGKTLPTGGIAIGKSLGILRLVGTILGAIACMAGGLVPGIFILATDRHPPGSARAAG